LDWIKIIRISYFPKISMIVWIWGLCVHTKNGLWS